MSLSDLDVVLEVGRRSWWKVLRRPVVLSFSFVQPLMWMAFFGFLFQRFPLESPVSGVSYLSFLTPGICCMTVLFGASQSGIALIRDMQTRFLARMLTTPAAPHLILAGKVLADAARLLAQAIVVLFLGLLLGASLDSSVGACLAGFAAVGSFGLGFSCLSCWIALRARNAESMATFVHLVNMPILFTSTALVPARQMPWWLEVVSRWNPLTLAVDALREALLSAQVPSPAQLAFPAWGALLLFWLASRAMARAVDS